MPVNGILADFRELRLRQRAARHRNIAGLINAARAAGGAEAAEEGVGTGADQVVEDEIRTLIENRGNHLVEFGVTYGQVPLRDHGAASRGQRLAKDTVVLPRPDVVGANAE